MRRVRVEFPIGHHVRGNPEGKVWRRAISAGDGWILNRTLVDRSTGAESSTVREQEIPVDGFIVSHTLDYEEVTDLLVGTGEFTVDGETRDLVGRSTVFVTPGCVHALRNAGDPLPKSSLSMPPRSHGSNTRMAAWFRWRGEREDLSSTTKRVPRGRVFRAGRNPQTAITSSRTECNRMTLGILPGRPSPK